jgi:hypothetical protein
MALIFWPGVIIFGEPPEDTERVERGVDGEDILL